MIYELISRWRKPYRLGTRILTATPPSRKKTRTSVDCRCFSVDFHGVAGGFPAWVLHFMMNPANIARPAAVV
jgi:hypothetical protein